MVNHLLDCRLHPLPEGIGAAWMFVDLQVAAVFAQLAGLPADVPAALLQAYSI